MNFWVIFFNLNVLCRTLNFGTFCSNLWFLCRSLQFIFNLKILFIVKCSNFTRWDFKLPNNCFYHRSFNLSLRTTQLLKKSTCRNEIPPEKDPSLSLKIYPKIANSCKQLCFLCISNSVVSVCRKSVSSIGRTRPRQKSTPGLRSNLSQLRVTPISQ